MAVNDSIIWIYIARRDKAGVKLLTQLRGKKILASHLESVDDLRLPLDYKDFIKKSIYEKWEVGFQVRVLKRGGAPFQFVQPPTKCSARAS